MAVVDINTGFTAGGRDLDNLVVRENYTARDGGVTLDTAGYPLPYIRAGHVVIRDTVTGELKPMPVTGTGAITTLGAITAGSAYDDDTYADVPLINGSGSGATANITVSGGEVTNVELVNAGSGYEAGDSLSADNTDLGGTGTGFAVAVTTVGAFATAYDSLPGNHTYYGHTVQTCATNKPFVGVFYHGKINPVVGTDAGAQAAGYFDLTTILTALQAALTHMIYEGDNA